MEKTNSEINLHFIDFDEKLPLYDQIELFREKDKIIPKRLITEKTCSLKFYYDYSFSTVIQLKLSNSKKDEIKKEYEIVIFKNISNEVYLLINESFPYQIDLYAQTTSEIFEKEKSFSVKVHNCLVDIPLNIIDKVRFKSIVYFCNVPLITFNCLDKGYQIPKEAISINHFKFCFYFLENKQYTLSIHEFNTRSSNEQTKDTANLVLNNLDLIEKKVDTMKKYIIKLLDEKASQPALASSYSNFFTALGEYLISIKDSFPLFYDIINLPLDYLPFTEQVLKILSECYFFSILNEIAIETVKSIEKIKKEDNNDEYKTKLLFEQNQKVDNANTAYEMIAILLRKDHSSIEIKMKKLSVYYTCIAKNIEVNERCDLPNCFIIETNAYKNNFYKKAIEIFKQCITNLTNESFLCEPLMLLNSKVSKDLNLNNIHIRNDLFEICIIDIEKIKEELNSLIPSFIFRWESKSNERAFFDIKSKCIVINELALFGKSMLEVSRDLSKPSKSYLATSVLIEYFHEIMGHGKRRAANALESTPEEYIFKGKIEKFNDGKEAGKIIEKYLASDEHIVLMKHSSSETLSTLQDYKLFTANTCEPLNKAIKRIERKAIPLIRDFTTIMKEEPIQLIKTKSGCVNDPLDYTKTYVYTMKTFDLGYT